MLLLHAADIHLDRSYPGQGLRARAAARREAQRAALERILEAARGADALCICGDLYEHEGVSRDTERVLVAAFAALPCPVLLLPGNHDPYLPGSLYERAAWSPNVHVFRSSEPASYELAEGVCAWGIAYTGRELDPVAVRRFRVPDDGRRHLLLLHASLGGAPGGDGDVHCPVTAEELDATGADLVLLGHHHGGLVQGRAVYPGSPEPLTWGERGVHAVCRVTVDDDGARAELEPVNRLSFALCDIDVTGAASSLELEERLRAELGQPDAGRSLRATLVGAVEPGCEVDPANLAARCGEGFWELQVRDRTWPAHDLVAIAREPTVRGHLVESLLARAAGDPGGTARYEAAARAALEALDGRVEVPGAA